MRIAIAALPLVCCVLTACGRERTEPPRLATKARPTPLVHNLYVIAPAPAAD